MYACYVAYFIIHANPHLNTFKLTLETPNNNLKLHCKPYQYPPHSNMDA